MIHSTVTAAFPPRLIPVEKEGDASMGGLRRLTEALVRGEDAAWVEFNGTYGPALFRQLLALTRGDHALTEEALQLTYLRVAKHVRPCETEAMFKAWLRTVARTALQDCWRRQRSFADLLFRKWQEPPELADPANDNHLIEQLDQALFRLDPTDRALLEGKYYSNLAVRTLAGQLGITSKAAESRLTRAREALRRELLTALRQHE